MRYRVLSKGGQFALEYILLFTAVVAVIATVVLKGGLFPTVVGQVMTDMGDVVESVSLDVPPASTSSVIVNNTSSNTAVIAPVSTAPPALTNLFSLFNNDDPNGKD